jgi:hypothetical protein
MAGSYRRLRKDYEFLPATSEAVIHLTVIQLLICRLASKRSSQTLSNAYPSASPFGFTEPWPQPLP